MITRGQSGPLPRFILLYALMYAAFGVASPFWPRFFESGGLSPEQLGTLFSAGTMVRLLTTPIAGRIADRIQAPRAVLAVFTAMSAAVALGLLSAQGFWLLLFISVCHAAALAPITVLADALALGAATPRGGQRKPFDYGWVRGAGSAAFIAGTLVAGQVVAAVGLTSIIGLHVTLLAVAACAALLIPQPRQPIAVAATENPRGSVLTLLRMPGFRRVLLLVALVFGSHAMHDSFAVIRWNAAGVGPATASVLWSEAVAAEVVVFFFLGPMLLDRFGPAAAAMLAASAGMLRWTVMALSSDVAALALVQPLHGLTFALLHLACMRVIGAVVPPQLAATAQAIYAVGAGVTSALLTLASGALYAQFGAGGFMVMTLLCALALPVAFGLRQTERTPARDVEAP
jgi:MFS transporter, PPP family, 3-phenylpropionic acid transporter